MMLNQTTLSLLLEGVLFLDIFDNPLQIVLFRSIQVPIYHTTLSLMLNKIILFLDISF